MMKDHHIEQGEFRWSDSRPSRRSFQFGLRTLLLVATACALLLGVSPWLARWWIEGNDGVVPIRVETQAWKRADEIDGYRTVRSQMIGDLLRRHDFTGWSRAKVIQLLGQPDPRPPRNPSPWNAWDMVYFLGLERGGEYSLDDEYLVFRLNAQQRVVNYRTVVN
jgi:hypothetical protein